MSVVENPIALQHDFHDERIIHITAGSNHTACCSLRHAWAWGNNSSNLRGTPDTPGKVSSPVQIPGTNWPTEVGKMAHGPGGSIGSIKSDGTLWMWGRSGSGMLAHKAFSAVTLTTNDSITITWTFTVGN